MPSFPQPANEADRQRTLDDFHILDGPSDEDLDRLTRLASQLLGLPIALISLVDHDRQWFLSRVGLEARETGREVAFCAHAICGDSVMVVGDASSDPRFQDNPLVRAEPHIRFYAGAPLRSHEGHNLGTLCVIGREPRQLSGSERQLLEDLAGMVMQQLESRRRSWRCSLTGLLNRRPFFEEGERELACARGEHAALSLLLVSTSPITDATKAAGRDRHEAMLLWLAGGLRELGRSADLAARVSAAVFALAMPATSLSQAHERAEALLTTLAARPLSHQGLSVPLDVHAAVGEAAADEADFPAFFHRVEEALERGRRCGLTLISA